MVRAALPLIALMLAAASPPPSILGTWANPHQTLTVRIRPCGPGICGAIVWAAPKAIADANEAGVANLIGTELLSDYVPAGAHRWSGRVYVPDMGRSFSSHIDMTAPDTIRISGCLVGSWFCRAQSWTRR
jgi:uncharacterized protein (DUF2147 family)